MLTNGQIARIFRAMRVGLALTQQDVAEAFGVDTTTISRWERAGMRIPADVYVNAPVVMLALAAQSPDDTSE